MHRVHQIQRKAERDTEVAVAAALGAKQQEWADISEPQPPEPDWIKVQKQLALELAPRHRDVVRENGQEAGVFQKAEFSH